MSSFRLSFFGGAVILLLMSHATVRAINPCDIRKLLSKPNRTYTIRHKYAFTDTLRIPDNCTLLFKGGSLSGPIHFSNTRLAGTVNLIGSIAKGTIQNGSINAAWFCYRDGKTDDAPIIQSLVDIADTVFFPKGRYYLEKPHEVKFPLSPELKGRVNYPIGITHSNLSLIGEDGATFIVSTVNGIICIYNKPFENNVCGNILINNLVFETKNDGGRFHEFWHSIKVVGVNGLTISNCKFDDFWGDAICLSHYCDDAKTGERTRNKNVKIINNTIVGGKHHNTRNGVSIISGEDVLISGNYIGRTSKSDMPGAIDIEADNDVYTVRNIIIDNNVIENCRGTAGGICVHTNKKGGPAHNVTISNNHIKNCTYGLAFVVDGINQCSNISVSNNTVESDTEPYIFVGEGTTNNWYFQGNNFKKRTSRKIGGKIHFTNLRID